MEELQNLYLVCSRQTQNKFKVLGFDDQRCVHITVLSKPVIALFLDLANTW